MVRRPLDAPLEKLAAAREEARMLWLAEVKEVEEVEERLAGMMLAGVRIWSWVPETPVELLVAVEETLVEGLSVCQALQPSLAQEIFVVPPLQYASCEIGRDLASGLEWRLCVRGYGLARRIDRDRNEA